MKAFIQKTASAFAAALLLSLCFTLTVFATEEPSGSGAASREAAKEPGRPEDPFNPAGAVPEPTEEGAPQEPPSGVPEQTEEGALQEPPSGVPEQTEEGALQEPPGAVPEPEEDTPQEPPSGVPGPTQEGAMQEPPGAVPEPEEDTPQEPPSGVPGPTEEDALQEPPSGVPEPTQEGAPQRPAIAASFNNLSDELTEPDTAATADELLEWLEEHENSEGTLQLTADIFLGDLTYMNASSKELTIDAGEFSVTATGKVYFWCSGLTLRGQGGEKGILRAARGGALSIGYMTIEAEEGFAVYQEEGGGLVLTQCTLDGNAVRYAETPFVWEWRPSLVTVEPGQTAADVLPAKVMSYDVNRHGQTSTEEAPVVWELAGHEAAQEQRIRFEAVGSTPGFAYSSAPVCTVIYNDFPLSFTWIEATETGRGYVIKGDFTRPEGRLPMEVMLEYSFDGQDWRSHSTYTVEEDSVFYFSLRKGSGEDCWDVEENPWLWLRVHWDDAGTHYYSNLLRFSGQDFGKGEDKGGNRGGGTDIIKPSEPPEPDLETAPPLETTPPPGEPETTLPPETTEPEAAPPPGEPETTLPPETTEPEAVPPPGEPETTLPPETTEPEAVPPPETTEQETTPPPRETEPETTPPPETTEPETTLPVISNSKIVLPAVAARSETALPPGKPETEFVPSASGRPEKYGAGQEDTQEPLHSSITSKPERLAVSADSRTDSGKLSAAAPDVLSLMAGVAAIIASIGAAALYLQPKSWKRLLSKLQKMVRR